MSNGSTSVAQVGIGTSSSTSLRLFSPRSAFDRLKEVVQSQQFQDAIKLFAIGAAVSASKTIADAILSAIKRIFVANAVFRGRDEAYRWMLLFMTTHPNFQKSPRAVEVSARPSLLIDSTRAGYRGELSEGEIAATWRDVQGKDIDDDEKAEMEEQQRQKEASLGVHLFPAAGEQMAFVFEGTRFWAIRERQLVGDTEWDETITLSFVSLSSAPLRKLIKHIRQKFIDHSRGRIAIHRVDDYNNWVSGSGISKRSIESVYLPGTMKEDLLADARRFISPETRK
jgi:chaperone BCS1